MTQDQENPAPSRVELMARGLYRDLRPHLVGLPWPEFRRLLVASLRLALARPASGDPAPPADQAPPS
ncbi:MAG: hypothetical protein LDL11_04680 [Desulfarculus sp.]|nr:hypothetical protein [Desulfarculus sp.]